MPLRLSRPLVLAVCLLLLASPPARLQRGDGTDGTPHSLAASAGPDLQVFLRVETSSLLYNVLYRWGRVQGASDGAYGPNITAPRSAWYLEYQRAGSTDVIAGIERHDPSLVADGLRMFHFGLAREGADGSFPGSAWPFHGAALFLSEAAPALLVLKYSPMQDRFAGEIHWQVARMHRAAYHMVRSVGGPGHIDDTSKNHRYYEAAIALEAVAVLAGDARLRRWSTIYAWRAIHMQRGGVMPEDGGHDSGYQAVGLVNATRYLTLAAHGRLYRELYHALTAAEAWEFSRVHPDGTIDQSGDTRTVDCHERDPAGRCKTTFYAPIFDALARWSIISGNNHYARRAYQVWLQNWQRVPGDVLPPPGLWVNPSRVQVGRWLTVWGTRFQPLEVVRVYFGSQLEQTVTSDQTGSFGGHSPQPNAHFPIPPVPPGVYTVTARGSYGTIRETRVSVAG